MANPVKSDGTSATTGRYVVVLSDGVFGDEAGMATTLRSVAGVSNLASATDFADNAVDLKQVENADAILFPALGAAVIADPGQAASLIAARSDGDERIADVEPEQTLHAVTQPAVAPPDYLRGYSDALFELLERANGRAVTAAGPAAKFVDTPAFAWGLQATKADTSNKTGSGVPLAVLDTGFDLQHPDFVGRSITIKSFVSGEAPQDGNGHGTHTTGTTSGPQRPPGGHRRYGVAFNDKIYVGKVLNDRGVGTDLNILAGIEWALISGCRVISMSLGADVPTPSVTYEKVGQRALAADALIVAAAGNNADRRQNDFGFVIVPANSTSIMAVGAVDSQLQVANFSARTLDGIEGGGVDIVGPGVDVDSSWPMPLRYNISSGTSMATPHVSGVAALLSQATGVTGLALWGLLVQTAKRLPLPSVDVGVGLVQAPQ
jgi:subtilisin family serine protease